MSITPYICALKRLSLFHSLYTSRIKLVCFYFCEILFKILVPVVASKVMASITFSMLRHCIPDAAWEPLRSLKYPIHVFFLVSWKDFPYSVYYIPLIFKLFGPYTFEMVFTLQLPGQTMMAMTMWMLRDLRSVDMQPLRFLQYVIHVLLFFPLLVRSMDHTQLLL